MLRKLFLALGALLALAGCDLMMKDLKPGVSTLADVRKIMGEPAHEWKESDGGVTLEYPRGPSGVVTYMVTLGSDGILKEIRQVLTDAYFAKIVPGMTKDEVRRLVGRPAETMVFRNRDEDVWSWRYEPATGERWMYHVHFRLGDGKVYTTSRNQVDTPP